MGRQAKVVAIVGGAVALLTSAPSVAASWAGPPIQPKGWIEVGGDQSLWVWYKTARARGEGESPQIWERVEFSHSDLSVSRYYLSAVSLLQFDCPGSRERVAQTTIYELNNLMGVIKTDTRADPWKYPEPGSYGDDLLKIACGGRVRADQ
jgi:hypothetical protein